MKLNNQKRIKILFLLILVFILIPKVFFAVSTTEPVVTTTSSTEDYDYNILYVLEAPLGDTYIVNNIVDYFLIIYKFAVASAAILATIVIMAGGLMWAASAGNESQIGKAKELITGAVIGMILAVGSYLILSTINPALINLKVLSPDYIRIAESEDFSQMNIYDLPDCATDAKFKDQCGTTDCGTGCSVNDQGKTIYCKGTFCDTDPDGRKIGCYPFTNDGKKNMSCQMESCGKWADAAIKSDYSKGVATYNEKLCGYYGDILKKLTIIKTDFTVAKLDADPTALDYYTQTCNESKSMLEWEDYFKASAPTYYDYLIKNGISLNCHYECTLKTQFTVYACLPISEVGAAP